MTGKPITELRLGQCRFPVTGFNTDRHLFCAEAVESPGAAYCPVHAALCYDRRPEEVRRAQRERTAAARLTKTAVQAAADTRSTNRIKF